MKTSATISTATAAGLALLALTSCAANEGTTAASQASQVSAETLSGILSGAGASSQGTAQATWIAAFQSTNPDATIEYDPSGSGAGREAFQQGAVAFAGSDRAFKTDEISGGIFAMCATNDLVELPVYLSPIAIVFNVPGITGLNLDPETIARIFTGQITNWNDPALSALNPETPLPDLAVSPVHRADKSGTTGNFTEYLASTAPETWTAGSVEEWPAELGGEAANQTSGLVDVVSKSPGTIGYADASKASGLGTASIRVGDAFVPYTPEGAAAVIDASPQAAGRSANDLAIDIDRTATAPGSYPLVLVSYLIGCEQYEDPSNAELVKAYFATVTSEAGQRVASESSGSAPISSELRARAQSAIDAIR